MIYTFKNIKTNKVKDYNINIKDYDQFCLDNPKLMRWIETAPAVAFDGKHFGSLDAQTDNGFKEVLAKIGERMSGTPLADRYAKNQTIAQVKTKELRKKHKDLAKKRIEERAARK